MICDVITYGRCIVYGKVDIAMCKLTAQFNCRNQLFSFALLNVFGSLIVVVVLRCCPDARADQCSLWEESWVTIQVPIPLGYLELSMLTVVQYSVVAQDEVNFN